MTLALGLLLAALPVQEYAVKAMGERLAAATNEEVLSRFADYPPSKGVLGFPRCLFENPFPQNQRFWLKDVDFSCASPWNDSSGTVRAGTAISKRHVVFAAHFPLGTGTRILFVGPEGGVCPCRIQGTKRILGSDIMVASLDAELTPNITPAKILPSDYENYVGNGAGLPVVTFDQHEKVFLSELKSIPTNTASWVMRSTKSSLKCGGSLNAKFIVGDSGNPAFILIGKQPVLVYCLKHGGSGSGHALHLYRREIQKAMDELCPGYKLECFDFSRVKMESEK